MCFAVSRPPASCAAGASWSIVATAPAGPTPPLIWSGRAAILAWLEETPLEAHFGRDLPRIETERYQLVIDTGEVREGRKKKVDAHTLSHLVADDVERVAELMAGHFEVKEGDYHSKMRMWMWKGPEDHATAMAKFLGSTGTGDFKILGRMPVFSVWKERPLFDEVPEVRSLFAHNRRAHAALGHAPFHVVRRRRRGLVRRRSGPLVRVHDLRAHQQLLHRRSHPERELRQRPMASCNSESTEEGARAPAAWTVEAEHGRHAAVRPGPVLVLLLTTLVAEHPQTLRPILEDLKKRRPAREIFTERLGMGVIEADAAWREWVPTVYPTKGDKPKAPKKKKKRRG